MRNTLLKTGKDSPKERVSALIEATSEKDLKLMVISDPKHIYYFTGFATYKPRFSSYLIIEDSERATLLLGESEARSAETIFKGNMVTFKDYDLNERMIAYPDYVSEQLQSKLGAITKQSITGKIGIEDWHLSKRNIETLRQMYGSSSSFSDLSETILHLRKTKGKDEVAFLKQAASRIDQAFKLAAPLVKEGISEHDVYCAINTGILRKHGAFGFWENPTVFGDYVSGLRTLKRGGPPTRRRIKRGDTLILDLQTRVGNYWCDTTRTFVVGRKSVEQQKVFKTLTRALKIVEEMLRPGTKGREIFQAISKTFVDSGFNPPSSHMGHGVGLDDQEPPFFLPNSNEELEEGVVCAIEPGIYDSSSGGIRIEEEYLITHDGFQKLSRAPLFNS